MKLTKMADVNTIIRGGGSVRKVGTGGLLALYSADGKQVDAWQNAIKASVTFLRYEPLEAAAPVECPDVPAADPGDTVDLSQLSPGAKATKFGALRGRVKDLADYFAIAGKRPPRIVMSPADYVSLMRGANARIRIDARAAAQAENERRKAEGIRGKRVKPNYREAHAMTWSGIPLVEGPAYSKPRPVDTNPIPTTSALAP